MGYFSTITLAFYSPNLSHKKTIPVNFINMLPEFMNPIVIGELFFYILKVS